jgi:multisubunit Na+/H+ antiporter MnhB subunit
MSNSPFKLLLLVLLLSIFELGLAVAVLFMPHPAIDIGGLVQTQLSEANMTYPVTALLINFRGYDTLLCITVPLFAFIGIRIVYPVENASYNPPLIKTGGKEPLSRWILLLLVLTVGYILWVGALMPQSPFQIGAVLASLGILSFFRRFKDKMPPNLPFSKS